MNKIMNKKIKLTLLSVLAFVALFSSVNIASARQPDVTCNSAVIYGNVSPNGTTVSAWFEWGTNESDVIKGNGTRTYSEYISYDKEINATISLSQNTTYYYRAAMNSDGNYIPATTEKFTTPACAVIPPPASTYTVTATAGAGGNISPSSTTVTSGQTTNFSVTPFSGYTINSVTGCNGNLNGNTYTTGPITSNCPVYASFTANPIINNPTVTLTANPQNINSGDTSNLTWSSNYATSCSASWTRIYSGTLNGTAPVSPLQTTTYSVTCSGASGTTPATASTTVYVNSIDNTAPTVSLTPSVSYVNYGSSTYLNWTTSGNASYCTASGGTNGWAGSKGTSGGFPTGNLYTDTTYSIICYGNNGAVSNVSTAIVYVRGNTPYNQVPVVNLYANPSSVAYGSSTSIYWNPTNSPTYCTASGGDGYWSGSRSTYNGNFYTGALYGTTTYTMTCGNSAGAATESVTVYVTNNIIPISQVSVSLTSDLATVAYNSGTTVRWYPSNATSCYANGGSNGWAGSKTAYSGSFYTGALTSPTTYSINCTNYNGGSDTKSVTIYTTGQQIITNQPTVILTADDTSLTYGDSTTLRWHTTNAASCYASGGSTGWEGTKSIGPASFYTASLTSNKTYTIVCSNSYGSDDDTVTVRVREQAGNNPAPVKTSLVLITSSVDRNQPIVPTIDNTRPKPGDEINYTVNYQNIGTGAITNLSLMLNLPQEVNYISSNPNNPNMFGNQLTFKLGTLKANGQGAVTVRVKVISNVTSETVLNFPATLSYTDPSGQSQSVNANVSAQIYGETTDINVQQGALAFLFGGSFFPNTLLGWLLLLVLIVLIILAIRKAYYTPRTVYIPQNPDAHH